MGRPLQPRRLPSRYDILPDPSPELRATIVVRYARVDSYGVPQRCAGNAYADGSGVQRKVIFDTVELARQCAIDMRRAGSPPQWPYECPHSTAHHAHLSHKRGHDVKVAAGELEACRLGKQGDQNA